MGYKVYEDIINLELMWQMRGMIAEAAGQGLPAGRSREPLFRYKAVQESMESRFGFRYPGEVLERYQERCGDTVQNLRALAIAVADEKEFLKDSMFIGNQKVDFIRKIRRDAGKDVYLRAALYILTEGRKERESLAAGLREYKAKDSQEYFLIRSVLGNQISAKGSDMQEFSHFLSQGRTIEAYGNAGIFLWAAEFAESIPDSGCRRKAGVARSLSRMRFHQVKEGSVYWEELSKAGYSRQEILYLNVELPFLVKGDRALTKESIIAERIAAQACKEILNADHVESPVLYEEVLRLLHLYDKFSVKLEGYRDLPELLKGKVKIRDVDLFLHFYKRKDKSGMCIEWFWVDLSEDRWDRLASSMSLKEYTGLFEDCFLSCTNRDSRVWLAKYERLCGTSYISRFWTENGNFTDMIFCCLVREGILDMTGYLTEYTEDIKKYGQKRADDKWNHMHKRMARKAKELDCRDVFGFWDAYDGLFGMEALRKYTKCEQLVSLAIDFEWYQSNRPYFRERDRFWQLDFLSAEEQRKLFFWASDEVYLHWPEKYNAFLLEFLGKKGEDLFSKDQCRELFDTLVKTLDPESHIVDMLRNKFCGKEELERFAEQKRMRREEEEKRRMEEQKKMWEQSLFAQKDSGSTESPLGVLAGNYTSYISDKRYHEIAYAGVLSEIEKGNSKIACRSLSDFLQMVGRFMEKGVSGWEDILGLIDRLEVVDDRPESGKETNGML